MRVRRRSRPGAPPGTILADPHAGVTTIRVMAYNPSDLHEADNVTVDQLSETLKHWPMIWIDVTGLGTAETIQQLGNLFGVHALALEDVVNVHQRAKADPYDANLFLVARMCNPGEQTHTEQVSFFVKKGLVLTFQERPGDCWNPIRERIRQSRGRVRSAGSDYLTYSLLDSIVDSYFPVVDEISDELDRLDAEVSSGQLPARVLSIHEVRGQLLSIRRAIRPHRELMNELTREETPLITDETRVFFRDCYDHVIQLLDLVDTYRELAGDLRDFYMSANSNRLNEVMKVLTIIATIFMPLSFVAGVYGMNFDTSHRLNMPELSWPLGYFFALSIMLGTAITMLAFFRRKKWI